MATTLVPIFELPVYDSHHPPEPGADYSGGAVFLVDKPTGWSSFDIVRFLRNRIRVKKTGHAGTLDPLATGLMILCSGKATKSVSEIQEYPKRYLADVCFGASTPSQDAATQPDKHAPFDHIDREMAEELIQHCFTGAIQQIPPMYSALWKDGKRLYTYARKGEIVEREPREVVIHRIKITSFEGGRMILDITCSKGTYVRTLAHDIGIALETRAHLSDLRRTEIGPFRVYNALGIDLLRDLYQPKEG